MYRLPSRIARRAGRAAVALALLGPGLAACRATVGGPGPAATVSHVEADVRHLADDSLEGRATGTAGNDAAAAYIARRFAALGLRSPLPGANAAPCAASGTSAACAATYFQRFDARSAADAHAGRTTGRPTQNVVAVIPGTDPALRGQYVVLGAHFDHLGRSTEGALDPQAGSAIRNGADDNASGTAAVLELARRFALRPARRSLIVVAFSGEELGILGSQHFVTEPPVPLDSVQAMLNFDMVGRLRDDRLIVYGLGTAAELPALVDSVNVAPALALSKVPDGYGPSDHSAFYARGIPVLHLFTDVHDDYHRATDDAEKINYAGIERVVGYAERAARALADRPARLTPIRTAPPVASGGSSSGSSAYFGSVPDMGAADVPGLRITGVTPGSPADRAGLKAGDVVVEFGGMMVTDLYTYTDALRARKPGDEVKVVVTRGAERLTLTAVLGTRP
ncbi:MAG TPA: M28 family peptidase [Gemmatimonadaceae bacterium]